MLAIALFTTSSDFNPRSYKRSDKKAGLSYTVSGISIHAPTRGATVDVPPEWFVPINFNPRSYKRSDGIADDILNGVIISIHAPTRGATVSAIKQ